MEHVLIVSAAQDVLAEGDTGQLGNRPEERKRRILSALTNQRSDHLEFDFVSIPEQSLEMATLVHDPGMIAFFEEAWTEWTQIVKNHPNSMTTAIFGDYGNIPVENRADQAVVPAFVCKFGFAPRHDGAQLIPPGASILSRLAFYGSHIYTPIHESTLPTLKWDLAVTRRAVEHLIQAGNDPKSQCRIFYSQNIHPGHHAGPATFGGFCFLNHAAIAVKLLQQSGKFKKVAIIDVDYHHGNGTMATFWNDPTVFFASIHGDPNFEYPFTSGFVEQIGGPAALNTTMNLPLAGGTNWTGYKPALSKVIQNVKNWGADALVISLGLDTLSDDPVTFPQARFALKVEDFVEMGSMLLGGVDGAEIGLKLPTIIIQEGGYLLDEVPKGVLNFLTRSV